MTLKEIESYQYTVWLEPSIYGYSELFDLTDSDFSDISFGDLITIAQKAAGLYMLDPDSRCAFLTYTQQHVELAEFYIAAKSLANGVSRELGQFQSRASALEWLSERLSNK
ncbi:MAG: hypothetical protein OEY11_01735 [Gammaproteobacteria bacterium]|nr:hypothetical protein [Gammaproteobacteria bacterium]